ncbi:MAG: DAK2 domain-containing protein [Actinobacteria bacterium]|nr:DAK2 domain-containing protein [Actinomycetota bacterium]
MVYKLNKDDVIKVIDSIVDNFRKSEAEINSLNVFPVPDGDTGTNMLLTLKSIREELTNEGESFSLKTLAERISFGALMGARGNSGVILSQILKGFLDVVKSADNRLDLNLIEKALKSSRDLAYSSVQDPTEGTMLTVIKDIHRALREIVKSNNEVSLKDLLDDIIKETGESVIRTTYLLPVLKQADVVDAGAQGILEILVGLRNALSELGILDKRLKKEEELEEELVSVSSEFQADSSDPELSSIYSGFNDSRDDEDIKDVQGSIKYIYCTELIVKGQNIDVRRFREDIESLGDSAMVVGDERLVKIHVHTNVPHRVLRRALREGTLHDIKINNMIDQSMQATIKGRREEQDKPKIKLAVVSNGSGFEEIFKSIGADVVIKGGQTMNPSTYDIVKTLEKIDAEKIILFPNNKNIIPTAKQAKKILRKELIVIPTKTIPQGIAGVLNYNADLELEENISNIERAIKNIKSGEVTVAVRDANLLVGEIKKGNFIGLHDGKVRVISENVVDAVVDLVKEMVEGNESLLTFYTGRDAKQEDTEIIEKKLKEQFPNIEIEFYTGGQPFYPYIFSIE